MKSVRRVLTHDGKAIFIIALENLLSDASGFKAATKFDLPMELAFPGAIKSYLSSDLDFPFLAQIGSLEANFLNSTICFIGELERESGVSALDELHTLNNLVINVAHALWRVRDNCVNVNVGFLLERHEGGYSVHKRTIREYYYDAHGLAHTAVKFTYKELKDAFTECVGALPPNPNLHAASYRQNPTTRVHGLIRQDRFHLWIRDARRQEDLLTRISLYITAIEALLSTSNSELAHQLSERVAIFLPTDLGLSKLDHYQTLKRCYTLRSKGLHGDVLREKDSGALEDFSHYLDNVCRTLFNELLENSEFSKIFESDDSINLYSTQRLFQ